MKINQLVSEMATVAGSVASVAKPMGETQKRPTVRGLQPVGSATKKKKAPYANSLSESKMKDLSMDLRGGRDGLNDADFKKKYGKSKEEMRKSMQQKPKQPVQEAQLDEEDLILVPGQGVKRKTGFVQHGQSRVDHEVEMAKSDLLQLFKNTKTVMMLIKDRSEDEGLEGWVQEKIIKAADYMNTLAEYLEGKSMQEMSGGVIAGGGVGEGMVGGYPFNANDPRNWAKKKAYDNRTAAKAEREANKPPKLAATKSASPKLMLSDVWRKVEDVVGQIYPDGDPIDWLLPWFRKQGIADHKIGDILDRAAKKNGYKDIYDYYHSFGDDLGLSEGAKVDRMVKHIAKSERGLGHPKKEAENIAWATANKRGYLDNKNKKA